MPVSLFPHSDCYLIRYYNLEQSKKVVERGIVQFRADPDMMEQLLELLEKRGIPLGTMAREWLKERLNLEDVATTQANEITSLCTEIRDKVEALEKRVQSIDKKLSDT